MQLQTFMDKLKLRHFEDMEQVENLVRSSAKSVEMTRSDYLMALRHVYHDSLMSL